MDHPCSSRMIAQHGASAVNDMRRAVEPCIRQLCNAPEAGLMKTETIGSCTPMDLRK
jgi:hypothetical protein